MQSNIHWADIARGRLLAIGECMVELTRSAGTVKMGFAGDTLNTTLYLARLLAQSDATVDYMTALGDDSLSDEMLETWRAEGIGVEHVQRITGALPGLYWIDTDEIGERSFHYWREQSAARRLLKVLSDPPAVFAGFDLVYYSGITLAILDDKDRKLLLEQIAACRDRGSCIVFDPNYRARLWNNVDAACHDIANAYATSDVILTGMDDEQAMFGDDNPERCSSRLLSYGPEEVIITRAGEETLLANCETHAFIRPPSGKAIDTTGAGDAFNAAYLAARIQGSDMPTAIRLAQTLAGKVIACQGAILPADQMP